MTDVLTLPYHSYWCSGSRVSKTLKPETSGLNQAFLPIQILHQCLKLFYQFRFCTNVWSFSTNITNIWLSSNSGRQWTLSSTSTERSIWPLRTRKNVKDQTLKKEKQIYPDDNVLQGKESVLTEAEGNFMSTRRWQPTRTISKRSSMPSRWVFSITTSSKNYQQKYVRFRLRSVGRVNCQGQSQYECIPKLTMGIEDDLPFAGLFH